MRRMYSVSELKTYIKKILAESPNEVKEALLGQDIKVNGITSKGIANTGGFANIGDVAISGDLNVQGENKGNISATGKITGGEIVENMSGYSFTKASDTTSNTFSYVYAGAVKNGNKLTLVLAFNVTKLASAASGLCGDFSIPTSIMSKLYPVSISGNSYLARGKVQGSDQSNYLSFYEIPFSCYKSGSTEIRFTFNNNNIPANATAYIRIEMTFLLSENLVPQE